MARAYHPFIIRVDEQKGEDFPVRAEFQGSSRSTTIPASLPMLTGQEIQQAIQWLERGFIDRDYAKDFGYRLFQTLFQDNIQKAFQAAFERVASDKDGLRIILTLPKALVHLPWELMYDEKGKHGFLARSATAPLVRHFEVELLPHEPPEKGPLRVLIVTASPSGYPPVSNEEEVKKIRKSLAKRRTGILETARLLGQHLRHTRSLPDFLQRIRHRNLFEIEVLNHVTRNSLQKQILNAQGANQGYHVVHFIGHGHADESGGSLVFESDDGKADLVSADEFAEMLAEPTIVLAVLNACQTASAVNLFQGVAQASLQRGVPAVIGMQVPILDETAVDFAQEFYGAWAAGQPIEGALAYARRLMHEEASSAASDWGIPILFMGPVEGLMPKLKPKRPPSPTWWRFLRWSFATLIGIIGVFSALLAIPSINKQLRTEVPVINCLFPYPMENGFNVVVTPLSVFDENQNVIWSNDGHELAEYFYRELGFNFEGLELRESHEIRPPAHTCRIKGSTREEREERAAAFAERINADVVVYGVIVATENQGLLTPEFYVNQEAFQDGEEVTGKYQLGNDFQITLPFDADKYSRLDNLALTARTEALSLITVGLTYYSIDDFENAIDYFKDAEDTDGWLKNAGKEYIYLLLGNATNRQASQDKSILRLDTAIDHFDKALEIRDESTDIEDEFARAIVGKAGALYLKALGDPSTGNYSQIDLELLAEAELLYNMALTSKNQPTTANITTKVHFGLGKIEIARALHAHGTEDMAIFLAKAETEFSAVVDDFHSGNLRVANLAGHAYYFLSLTACINENTSEAIEIINEAFGDKVIDDEVIVLLSPYYQSEYTAWKGELYFKDSQLGEAISFYQEAIDIAESYANEEQIDKFSERLRELINMQGTDPTD